MSDQMDTAVSGNNDERTWAMFCHLAAAIGMWAPVPFGSIIGPLIVWLIKRDKYPLVRDQGKESLNFQISIAILIMIVVVIGLTAFIPAVIATPEHSEPPIAAMLIWFAAVGVSVLIGLADIVFVIIAAIQVNKGAAYRYPIAIRFIK